MPPERIWMQPVRVYTLMSYILHKIKGNVPSFLCIIENNTIKLYEKMRTGPHAFQTGQYEHDGFILTTYICLQRDWLNKESVRTL